VLGRPGKKDKALCGWNAFFQMKPPNWQRRLIRKPWEYPVVAMHLAACLLPPPTSACVQRRKGGGRKMETQTRGPRP
jgi:hypothetical protein